MPEGWREPVKTMGVGVIDFYGPEVGLDLRPLG
jgi:hypothetical protein